MTITATGATRTARLPLAFFSIDGGKTDLAQFDNQNDGGDWGDWQSNPVPHGSRRKCKTRSPLLGSTSEPGGE